MNHTLAALALALLLGPGISAQARSSRKNDDRKASVSWSAAADYATGTLADNFWRVPDNGFVGKQPPYHFTNGVKGAEDFPNNYWPTSGRSAKATAKPKPSTKSASTRVTATRSARAKSKNRPASSGPATA